MKQLLFSVFLGITMFTLTGCGEKEKPENATIKCEAGKCGEGKCGDQ